MVRRLSGVRSRTEARKSSPHRDSGAAAKKRRRYAEQDQRLTVRRLVREQIAPDSVAGEHAASGLHRQLRLPQTVAGRGSLLHRTWQI